MAPNARERIVLRSKVRRLGKAHKGLRPHLASRKGSIACIPQIRHWFWHRKDDKPADFYGVTIAVRAGECHGIRFEHGLAVLGNSRHFLDPIWGHRTRLPMVY